MAQPGLPDGDGRFRGQQLEDGHSSGGERVRREAIFQIQDPEQSGLLENRQAEHRPCVVPADILIGGKWVLAGGVIQKNACLRSYDIA